MGYKTPHEYVLCGNASSTNPSDGVQYEFGSLSGSTISNTMDVCRMYIPKRGRITRVQIYILAFTVAGSAENVPMLLRVNDTTNYAIETKGLDAGKKTLFSKYDLNIPVIEGDFCCIRFTAPAWVTNPTSVFAACNIYIECD
jgi:hypothetical protein